MNYKYMENVVETVSKNPEKILKSSENFFIKKLFFF